jgi:hypothetical protein
VRDDRLAELLLIYFSLKKKDKEAVVSYARELVN